MKKLTLGQTEALLRAVRDHVPMERIVGPLRTAVTKLEDAAMWRRKHQEQKRKGESCSSST